MNQLLIRKWDGEALENGTVLSAYSDAWPSFYMSSLIPPNIVEVFEATLPRLSISSNCGTAKRKRLQSAL